MSYKSDRLLKMPSIESLDTGAEEKGKLGGLCFLHITCKLKALSNLPHNISKTVENESTKILIMTLDAKRGRTIRQ